MNEPRTLNLNGVDPDRAFKNAAIYKKRGLVNARIAKDAERITTTLKDGTVETTNTAQSGDVIVTNPMGEEYVMPMEKFAARYEPTDASGVF